MAVKLAEAYVEITTRDTKLDRGLGDAKKKVSAATRDMSLAMTNEVQAVVQTAQNAVRQVGMGLTAALTAPIVALGVAATKAASSMEQLEISYSVMLGGADKAKKFVTQLQDMADKTPFTTHQLSTLAQQLLVVGVNAVEVIPVLRTIGDAAAASPLGMEEGAHRIARALGDIKQAGRVTADNMRQLTEAGIPAWEYLAKAMGMTTAEARKLSEQGKVSGGTGINAILAGMHGRFGGLMERQSQSLAGRWSTALDHMERALKTFGDTLLDVGKRVLGALEPIVRRVREFVDWFSKLPGPVRIATVAVLALAAAAGPLLLGFSALSGIVVGLAALAAILTTMGPLMAVLGTAATAFGVVLVKLWPAVKAGFQSMWKSMKPGLDSLKAAWAGMRDALASVWAKLQVLFSAVSGFGISVFQKLGAVVGSIVKVMLHGISMAIHGLTSLMNTVLTVINTVLEGIREVMRWIRPFVDALRQIPLIGGVAGGAYDKLVAFLDKLINVGKGGAVKKVAEHSAELQHSLSDAPTITTEDDPVVEGYGARAEAILNEIEAIKREREEASRARRDRLGIFGLADLGRRAAIAGAGHQFGSDWSRIPVGFRGINDRNWRRLMSPDMIGEASRRISMRDAHQEGLIKTIIDYLASIDRNTVDKTSRFGGHKGY